MRIDLEELLRKEKLHLFFELAPPAPSWRKRGDAARAADGVTTAEYECDRYRCQLALAPRGRHQVLSFRVTRADGAAFTVRRYGIKGTQELVDTLPYTARLRSMIWDYRETSNASTGALPLILYGSRNGENRFAVGFGDPSLDTEKRVLFEVVDAADRKTMIPRSGRKAVLTDKEVFSLTRPADAPFRTIGLEDSLFLSNAPMSWFDVERDYTEWLDARTAYGPHPFPVRLVGPVWCSWCFTTDIDQDLIWSNAVVAAELGFRLLIIDAGWYHRSTDVIWPEESMTKEQIAFGRLLEDRRKFPDFRGLIRRIKDELGLGVMLWVAPRYLFRPVTAGGDRIDRRLLASRVVGGDGRPGRLLCTRTPATREHSAALVRRLIEELDIDGIKIDAWGEAGAHPCRARHVHDCENVGRGIERWARAIGEGARELKKDFIIWLDTAGTKTHGSYGSLQDEIWCNYDAHYIQNIHTRTQGTGFPRQVCDGGWHPGESETNVARHLAVYLCGLLPELDMDLTILPEGHRRQVRAWFAFFDRHKTELLEGVFRPQGFEGATGGPHAPCALPVRIDGGSKTFVWCTPVGPGRLVLDDACRELYLFNLTNRDDLELEIEWLEEGPAHIRTMDPYLDVIARTTSEIGRPLDLRLEVPRGGAAVLVR